MFDFDGNQISIRKPTASELEEYGQTHVTVDQIAFAVFGEDIAECLIMLVGHDGEKYFEACTEDAGVLASYYCGACEIARALEGASR